MITIILEVELISPFSSSLETLFDFANIRGFRIIASNSLSPIAKIEIPWKLFKDLYHKNPILGDYGPPTGSEKFIAGMTVLEINSKGE